MMHADRFYNGTALIVLGGPSGKDWEKLRDKIEPDVLITANGATRLPGADYWMLTENMKFCHTRGEKGNKRLKAFMHVLDKENTADHLLISHRTWPLLPSYGIEEERCIRIMRAMYPLDEIELHRYGEGFLKGPISQCVGWSPRTRVCLGTVGLQALHLAGILGCADVHTIGYDLMFKREDRHHWYEHPKYTDGHFRTPEMFVEYRGAKTQGWWVETAKYLDELKPVFERDGLAWRDHSDGLLTIEGVWSAV